MQSAPQTLVIIGTGGTIAGASGSATDNVGYKAGSLSVESLVRAVPALAARSLEAEQLAQLDSKDMDHATWARLAKRVREHLDRPEVRGVVITHGTDTLEETAYLLQRVLAPEKPVVLTAAMRPATAIQADGPQNLLDAVAVAESEGVRGVIAVVAGPFTALALLAAAYIEAARAGDGDLAVLSPVPDEVGLAAALLLAALAFARISTAGFMEWLGGGDRENHPEHHH